MNDVPKLGEFVQQRQGNDCEIAAIATAIGRSYEDVVSALGLKGGMPPGSPGLDIHDTIYALLTLGWIAAQVITMEWAKARAEANRAEANTPLLANALPTTEQLKAILKGRRAVIGYTDPDPEVGDHAISWDGSQGIDCSNGTYVKLEDIKVFHMALILAHLPAPQQKSDGND